MKRGGVLPCRTLPESKPCSLGGRTWSSVPLPRGAPMLTPLLRSNHVGCSSPQRRVLTPNTTTEPNNGGDLLSMSLYQPIPSSKMQRWNWHIRRVNCRHAYANGFRASTSLGSTLSNVKHWTSKSSWVCLLVTFDGALFLMQRHMDFSTYIFWTELRAVDFR